MMKKLFFVESSKKPISKLVLPNKVLFRKKQYPTQKITQIKNLLSKPFVEMLNVEESQETRNAYVKYQGCAK